MDVSRDELLDLTEDLKELVQLAAADDGLDDLLRRGLDWVARLAPYDLATVFEVRDGHLVVRAARGPMAGPAIRTHRLALSSFPTIREALETRRARVFTEDDHAHGDGDPFDGVLDLPPGHACMVVPLCAGDRCLGVMTLDRARCEPYPQPVADLVQVYAQVLALAIHHAEQRLRLARLYRQDQERVRLLEEQLAGDPEGVLASSRSPLMQEVVARARQVAATDTPVLILGETGTGKERLARAIHRWSRRAAQPFVALNCAAIPAGLLESELFGHVKGAFTGATRDRMGRFQMANGGTLLLDELGELPFELQAKLLRVLQENQFEPVGSDRGIKVDVRIVGATQVDLERALAAGRFRPDLFYRLNVFPLRLPALRERFEDLPALCEVLLAEQAGRTGRRSAGLTPAALAQLRGYAWPGNIRELANVIERATIMAGGAAITPDLFDVPAAHAAPHNRAAEVSLPAVHEAAPPPTLADAEREHIRRALAFTGGRLYGPGGAAAVLGLKPSTLQSRMKRLGIRRE
ncbi:sigma 54-interacting transcriptional regulator [Candidatus Binatia bacterium]|nr:sigma 54-interacting transcriptional regulator [Candidatus Binatia bacterium]